jgi:nicotinic acid mononucleotide adenylyltransferase
MGSDQLPGLDQWRRVERVFQLASAAVAVRPGAPIQVSGLPGLHQVAAWSGAPGELIALPTTELDLASSDLRERLQAAPHEDPEGLPPQVLRTIRTENLYR